MGETILEMKNMFKRFPGVLALNDVSITLQKGEIVSIVGENGAGKSTLMKILSGAHPFGSYEGDIFLNGKKFVAKSIYDAEKVGISMIFQELNVELDLSVGENIMLGHWPRKKIGLVDWPVLHKNAKEALAMLDLSIDTRVSMRNLSTSLQQLVCIAKALIRKPKILILDEPTAALTDSETKLLMNILQKLKSDGISCIYISHKLEEVFDISDRVIAMRDARYISEYAKADIVPEQVIEDMVGRKVNTKETGEDKVFEQEVLRVENFKVKHMYATDKNIIEDVSFSLNRGEILGLAGLVGSGRSELLKAVFGVLPKTAGKVYLGGKPCNIGNAKDAIANGICMLSEDRKTDGFVGTMNIRENMTLSSLKKISRKTFVSRKLEKSLARKYFDYLNVKSNSIEAPIITLSGGNQQKVILAKLLLTEAKVLFLDEPTRGIDIGAKAEIYKIIRELTEQGISFVIISSELPELLRLCDRFIVLSNGYVGAEFKGKQVTQNDILHAAAFGSVKDS